VGKKEFMEPFNIINDSVEQLLHNEKVDSIVCLFRTFLLSGTGLKRSIKVRALNSRARRG
jgi:hypothetical protein